MYLKATLMSIFIIRVYGHTPKNNSDVYVTYEGHSEVGNKPAFIIKHNTPRTSDEVGNTKADKEPVTEGYGVTSEDVVFVPNERSILRNEDLQVNEEVKIDDFMARKYSNSVLDKKTVKDEVDKENEGVLFISGKNKENNEKDMGIKKEKKSSEKKLDMESEELRTKKVNCTQLDCNNTQTPVCGGKSVYNKMKYRLFLNECYFYKVNCAFRHRVNRYKKVDMAKCKDVAALNFETTAFKIRPEPSNRSPEIDINNTRKSFSSRRSLIKDIDGNFCSHSCPVSCTDDYDPQCAVTTSGQKQVFLNHCKLDYNSCLYKIVWHRRPLAWCVGGQAADMRQNRGFISWMQRTGIVDSKGRLSLH